MTSATAKVIQDLIDCLEYVDRRHPETSGWGVRAQRIHEARDLMNAEPVNVMRTKSRQIGFSDAARRLIDEARSQGIVVILPE